MSRRPRRLRGPARGSQFDPRLVDAFCSTAIEVLPGETDEYGAHELFSHQPGLAARLSDEDFDAALVALADFTDLRSSAVPATRGALPTWLATEPGCSGCPRPM